MGSEKPKVRIVYEYIPEAFDGVVEGPLFILRSAEGIKNPLLTAQVGLEGRVMLMVEGEAE